MGNSKSCCTSIENTEISEDLMKSSLKCDFWVKFLSLEYNREVSIDDEDNVVTKFLLENPHREYDIIKSLNNFLNTKQIEQYLIEKTIKEVIHDNTAYFHPGFFENYENEIYNLFISGKYKNSREIDYTEITDSRELLKILPEIGNSYDFLIHCASKSDLTLQMLEVILWPFITEFYDVDQWPLIIKLCERFTQEEIYFRLNLYICNYKVYTSDENFTPQDINIMSNMRTTMLIRRCLNQAGI